MRKLAGMLVLVAMGLSGGLLRAERTSPPTPLAIAQGHLRHAREYVKASREMADGCNGFAAEGFYAAAEAAWNAFWICPESSEILAEAANLYAAALEGLLEEASHQGRFSADGLWVGSKWRPIHVPVELRGLPIDASLIECVEPRFQPMEKRVTCRHVRSGVGWPVVIRIKPGPVGSLAQEFAPPRQSIAATAVLRFRVPGDEQPLAKLAGPVARGPAAAVLDLANPVEIAAVKIGGCSPPLAADLTAPLLDMLAGMPKTNLEGFLRPYGDGDTQPRLEFLEPHQPGRIPIVFIHGLASDEGTWFDLLNELRTSPLFHRRFEPWVYHYPTGASFFASSGVLRRELTLAVRGLDPEGRDPALANLMLVGHSMGGLHAKLQAVHSGNHLWESIAEQPFENTRMRPQTREIIRQAMFFEPLPFVKRVVFIATPHRGSGLAAIGVGRAASLTVRQPPEMRVIHDELVRLNPGGFHPDFEQRLPTTIDVLEPQSSILQAVYELRPPCWVTLHTIFGIAHTSITGERSDCVVNESSARFPGVVSEVAVPAKHRGVHHHPGTVRELERILRCHLMESGLEAAGTPATTDPGSQ